MTLLFLIVSFLTALSLGQDNNLCDIRRIPVQNGFDPLKMVGTWYQIRWYAAPIFDLRVDAFFDFSVTYINGTASNYSGRFIGEEKCIERYTIVKTKKGNAWYSYRDPWLNDTVESFMVYTDYRNLAVEFICYARDQLECTEPDVSFWSRRTVLRTSDLQRAEALLQGLCVDQTRSIDITHNKDSPCVKEEIHCWLDDIPVLPNFNEDRMLGTWYKTGWYPAPMRVDLDREDDTLIFSTMRRFLINARNPGEENCMVPLEINRNRLSNGVYTYRDPRVNRSVQAYMVDTDYTSYFIEFLCLEHNSLKCTQPEVAYYSKEKTIGQQDKLIISKVLDQLCVDNTAFLNVKHSLDKSCIVEECLLSQLPVLPNFDESRFEGTWFLTRWYDQSELVQQVHDDVSRTYLPGGNFRTNARLKGTYWCSINSEDTLIRVRNAVYYFRDPFINKTVLRYVVATDYNNYAVEMCCNAWKGQVCNDRKVAFWSRRRWSRQVDIAGSIAWLDQLCVDKTKYTNILHHLDGPCLRSENGQCYLGSIPLMTYFNPQRFAGVWYQLRYYPAPKFRGSSQFSDYRMEMFGNGTQIVHLRMSDGQCREFISSRTSLRPGVFTYYDKQTNRLVQSYIVNTNYVSYAVEFKCYSWSGMICSQPEVVFWSRSTSRVSTGIILDTVSIARLCVSTERFHIIQHNKDCRLMPLTSQCQLDSIPVVANFNEDKFLGKWFQMRWYPPKGVQVDQAYGDLTFHYYRKPGGRHITTKITARDPSDGECIDEFEITRRQVGSTPGVYNYWQQFLNVTARSIVVDTDYTSYFTRFSCVSITNNICHQPEASIWSRTKKMSDQTRRKALAQIPLTCVNQTRFVDTIVTLAGSCDRAINKHCRLFDIPVQENFTSHRYLGLWFEKRLYPDIDHEPVDSPVDHTIQWTHQHSQLFYTEHLRLSEEEPCLNPLNNIAFNQSYPGVYSLPNDVTVYVVYTDYTSFSVEFLCSKKARNVCTNPAVRFLSRNKKAIDQERMDIGEQLVRDLCVDPAVYADVLQQKNVTCTRAIKQNCSFEDIPTQPDFDEYQFLGKWYAPVWYPSNHFEPNEFMSDYSMIMWRSQGNLMHSAYARTPPSNDECTFDETFNETRIGPGTYSFHQPWQANLGYRKIVYTDYVNFALVAVCYTKEEEFCINPEVSLWSRWKTLRRQDVKLATQMMDQLCVDATVVVEIPQQNDCAPTNQASTNVRDHCMELFSEVCRKWAELVRSCDQNSIRACYYYERSLWSCHYEWWRCGLAIDVDK